MDTKKPNKKTNEFSFFTSFSLLVVALLSAFFVLRQFKPLESSQLASPDSTVAATEPTASTVIREEMRSQVNDHPVAPGASTKTTEGAPAKPLDAKPSDLSEDEIETKLSEAMKLVDAGNYQAAMGMLEQILASNPTHEMALVELGMIHLIDMKDPLGAQDLLEKALKVNPSNKVVLSELVGIYEELGQADAGRNFVQNLYEDNPDNSQLARSLGQIYLSQDKPSEALPYLKKSAESNDPAAMTEYSQALSESGDSEAALNERERIISVIKERKQNGFYDNQPPEVYEEELAMAHLGVMGEHLNQKDPEKAKAALDRLGGVDKDKMAHYIEKYQEENGILK